MWCPLSLNILHSLIFPQKLHQRQNLSSFLESHHSLWSNLIYIPKQNVLLWFNENKFFFLTTLHYAGNHPQTRSPSHIYMHHIYIYWIFHHVKWTVNVYVAFCSSVYFSLSVFCKWKQKQMGEMEQEKETRAKSIICVCLFFFLGRGGGGPPPILGMRKVTVELPLVFGFCITFRRVTSILNFYEHSREIVSVILSVNCGCFSDIPSTFSPFCSFHPYPIMLFFSVNTELV